MSNVISERPKMLIGERADIFWTKMAKKIIKGGYHDFNDEADADCVSDVAKDLSKRFNRSDNGFEYAKNLEREYGFKNIDVSFCEELDYIIHLYEEELNKAVEEWAKAANLQPKFDKGAKITATIFLNSAIRKDRIYFITGVKIETATYCVYDTPDHNGGYVISFEDLERCCVTAN